MSGTACPIDAFLGSTSVGFFSNTQVVVAARGQTISVAFYPRLGLVVYGSEAAATKAPLTVVPAGHKERLVAFFKENDPAKVRLDASFCHLHLHVFSLQH